MGKKSLKQIEFDLRHDVWIKADYVGPIITPDGYENKRVVFRRSSITGFPNYMDSLVEDPRYYRKPTKAEIKALAKIEYEAQNTINNQTAAIAPVETNDVNFLKQSGDYWQIGYEGEKKTVRNLDGMRYIALLLEKPGKSISYRELYQAVSGKTPDKIMTESAAIDESLNIGRRKQAISDAKARRDYATRYKNLQNDLENAESEMERQEIEKEMDAIIPCLRDKAFTDKDTKRFQSNIQKRLKTTYKAIDKAGMKKMAKHLRDHFKPDKKYGLSYTGNLTWNITQ